MRIEICGGIASGKTSALQVLGQEIHGLVTLNEKYLSNPFLPRFYCNPGKYAFETELTFLLLHYHQLKDDTHADGIIACDYSFYQDRAFVDVTLDTEQRKAFTAVFRRVMLEIGMPKLLVYLTCDPDTQSNRIRYRARKLERSIPISYLQAVNKSLERHIKRIAQQVMVVHVDTVKTDFIRDNVARNDLICRVRKALR